MAAIRSVADSAKKWVEVTAVRAADYEAGVRDPRRAWAASTLAAEDAWKAGIQEAITQKSFSKGVQRAGDGGWQSGAIEKGVARWAPGIAVSQHKYEQAVAPYFAAIARVQLPPRYARRDKRNMLRVAAIVDALVAVKTGRAV